MIHQQYFISLKEVSRLFQNVLYFIIDLLNGDLTHLSIVNHLNSSLVYVF